MKLIRNSLTRFLDEKLVTMLDVEEFLDNLEDEVLGINNRQFYIMYKGDIKELIEQYFETVDQIAFEDELLKGLLAYSKQRQITHT